MHQEKTGQSRPAVAGTRLATRLAVTPAALIGFFSIALVSRQAEVPIAFCVLKHLFGMPCPGCGITRSIAALLSGDVSRAIEYNAAGPFVVAFLFTQLALVLAAALEAAPDRSILRIASASDRWLFVVMLSVWSQRTFL